MSSTRLHRAVLTAFSTALVLVVVSTAHAAGTVVEGVGDVSAVGLAGTNAQYVKPTQIVEAAGATAAAVGYGRSFVLTPDGVLAAGVGNLGLGGGYDEALTFTPIPGTAGAKAVATGFDSTLILRGDGTVAAFGDGLAAGPAAPYTPTTIAGLDHVTAIAAGQAHAVALKSDGSVWAWGQAAYLGNSTVTADTGAPVAVALPVGSVAIAIAAGGAQSLALLQDGSVWGWGGNNDGEVGDGSTTTVADPVQVIPSPVAGAPRVTVISAGASSSFALYDDGSFRAWGRNSGGQLGLGNGALGVTVPTAPDPAAVAAHPDRYPPLASISSQLATTYAIARDGGRVYGWGTNSGALLGFGDDPVTYDFAFPYTGAAGSDPGQGATEIPQRIGRLKGAAWLAVGSNGVAQIVAAVPTLTPLNGLLPFFSQVVGTVSARSLAPIQSRDDPTTVTSIKIIGPDDGDFEVARYNKTGVPTDVDQLPLALAAGQYLNVYVRFNPTALGERNATLQVSGDGETTSIPLSGFGTALPGNTPGEKGADGTNGSNGAPGLKGETVVGPQGPQGPAGKDGVVTFVSKKATTTVKRGRTTTLSFSIKNATKGQLLSTTATATLPGALTAASGKRTIAVRALAAGASQTVKLKVKAGRRVVPGVSTVKVRVPYGTRAVTATAKVRVAR